MFNWCVSAYFEAIGQIRGGRQFCLLGLFNLAAFGEIVRSCSFILTLYALTRQSQAVSPLPYSWVFEDLSKFIFEPTCLQVFVDYLEQKEPKSKLISPQT